jgi:hypothetical protein
MTVLDLDSMQADECKETFDALKQQPRVRGRQFSRTVRIVSSALRPTGRRKRPSIKINPLSIADSGCLIVDIQSRFRIHRKLQLAASLPWVACSHVGGTPKSEREASHTQHYLSASKSHLTPLPFFLHQLSSYTQPPKCK